METSIDLNTLTEEEIQFIKDYHELTYIELTKKYNVCEQTINKWRKSYKLEKKKGRKEIKPCFKENKE